MQETQEMQVWLFLGQEDPKPPPVFLPRGSHGEMSLVGYSPQGRKEQDTPEVTEHAHA